MSESNRTQRVFIKSNSSVKKISLNYTYSLIFIFILINYFFISNFWLSKRNYILN